MMETEETKNIETYTTMRTQAGSCNFCTSTKGYLYVLVIRSTNESRNLSIRLCPTCQRELLETLTSLNQH